MVVKGRALPIPRFPAPLVNLLSESCELGHELWRGFGKAEVCSSSPMKRSKGSASVVSVLEARTKCPSWPFEDMGYILRRKIGLFDRMNMVDNQPLLSRKHRVQLAYVAFQLTNTVSALVPLFASLSYALVYQSILYIRYQVLMLSHAT